MKGIMLVIFAFVFSAVMAAAQAHDRYKPPEPTPMNVPDDGSNHNALAIGIVVIAGAICIIHQCWKPKPVKAESTITPEIPENEYMRLRHR